MRESGRYCVFRIVNEARREIYLAASPLPVFNAISGVRSLQRDRLKGWDLDDVTAFESLEFNLTREAAVAFMETRVNRGKARGYRYIADFPPPNGGQAANAGPGYEARKRRPRPRARRR